MKVTNTLISSTIVAASFSIANAANIVELPLYSYATSRYNIEERQEYEGPYASNIEIGTPPQSFKAYLNIRSKGMLVNQPTDGNDFIGRASSSIVFTDVPNPDTQADGAERAQTARDVVKIGGQTENNQVFTLKSTKDTKYPTAILGLAPESEAAKSLPVQFQAEGAINRPAYSFYIDRERGEGKLLFGAFDVDKYEAPWETFSFCDTNEIAVKVEEVLLAGVYPISSGSFEALLDTSSRFISLHRDFADVIALTLFGANYDSKSNTYGLESRPLADRYLSFKVGNTVFDVPVSEFIIDTIGFRSKEVDFVPDHRYILAIRPVKNDEPQVLGSPFLRAAYTLVDFKDKTVAVAKVKSSRSGRLAELAQ